MDINIKNYTKIKKREVYKLTEDYGEVLKGTRLYIYRNDVGKAILGAAWIWTNKDGSKEITNLPIPSAELLLKNQVEILKQI